MPDATLCVALAEFRECLQREKVDAICPLRRRGTSPPVAAAQCRNERDGLAGAPLFVDGLFVQALEGEAGRLEAAFERICRDLRHRRIVPHEFSEAAERVFAGWAMVGVPGTGGADGLFTSAAGGLPRAGRNTALAHAALDLMRDRLAGSAPRAGSR